MLAVGNVLLDLGLDDLLGRLVNVREGAVLVRVLALPFQVSRAPHVLDAAKLLWTTLNLMLCWRWFCCECWLRLGLGLALGLGFWACS